MAQDNNKTKTSLTERIALYDFDRHYTPKVRILCHAAVWLLYFGLTLWFFNVEANDVTYYHNVPVMFFLGVTYSIQCIATFYFFFYWALPRIIAGNHSLFVRISSFIIILYICSLFTTITLHYGELGIRKIFNLPHYMEGNFPTKTGIDFWGLLPLVAFMALPVVAIYNSPAILIKIFFGGIRNYAAAFKAERRASRLAIEKLQEETKFLRAQLNPHFLFNTFNNLYGLARKKDDRLPNIILQLSDIMNYITYESPNTDKTVPLERELDFIKKYVLMEKLRISEKKKIELDVNESDGKGLQIAPLLTFPFIENAFKYGLQSMENSFLEIKISIVENIFYFYIVNDKDTAAEKRETGGVGIRNVRQRLELLYSGKYQLNVEDKPDSFGVRLQIELSDEQKNKMSGSG